MLKHGFQEGTTLRNTGQVEIPLPEDDADAFVLLLNILHHRHRSVPETIALSKFVTFAVLVDKYEISLEAVENYTTRWITALRPAIARNIDSAVEDWIVLSWVFRLEDVFKDVTWLLITQSTNELSENFGRIIPSHVAGKSFHQSQSQQLKYVETINYRRHEGLKKLYNIVNENVRDLVSPGSHCDSLGPITKSVCDAAILGALLKTASVYHLYPTPILPVRDTSFKELVARFEDIRVNSLCDLNAGKAKQGKSSAHGLNESIALAVAGVETSIEGLELSEFDRNIPDDASVMQGEKEARADASI
jgi:hypothetical protein